MNRSKATKKAGNSIAGGKTSDNIEQQVPIRIIVYSVYAAVIFRMLITFIPSYSVDMGGYRAWSSYLATKGPEDIYTTFHIVYAPAYMYLLWISGMISKIFSFDYVAQDYIIKLWAVAAEFVGGYLIYLIGKKYGRQKTGFILAMAYVLNPGVFFNSSIWGQFDSIPATLLLGTLYCFNQNKKVTAILLFAIAILTKPQSGLLAPLVLMLFFHGFSFKDKKDIKKLILSFIGCFSIYIFVVTPFYYPTPFFENAASRGIQAFFHQLADMFYWMIYLYQTSLGDYPYATANAFNLWTLLGGQPIPDNAPFLGLNYSTWGFILLAAVIFLAVWLRIRKSKSAQALYFAAFFILAGSFMFATRMHERYLLPCLIFLTVCILWNRKLILPAALLSLCVAANHWYLYHLSWKKVFWLGNYDPLAMTVAAISLCVMVYMIYYILRMIHGKNNVISTGETREENT